MIKRGRKVDEWVVNGIGYENLCLLCIDGNAFCIVWILKKLGVTIQKKELLLINILTIFVVFTEFFIISSIRDLDFSLDYGRVKVITLITILLAIVGRGCFPYWEEDSDKSANNSSDLSESKNKKPKLNNQLAKLEVDTADYIETKSNTIITGKVSLCKLRKEAEQELEGIDPAEFQDILKNIIIDIIEKEGKPIDYSAGLGQKILNENNNSTTEELAERIAEFSIKNPYYGYDDGGIWFEKVQ